MQDPSDVHVYSPAPRSFLDSMPNPYPKLLGSRFLSRSALYSQAPRPLPVSKDLKAKFEKILEDLSSVVSEAEVTTCEADAKQALDKFEYGELLTRVRMASRLEGEHVALDVQPIHFGLGNCGEKATYAYLFLVKDGVEGLVRVTLVNPQNVSDNHAILLIGCEKSEIEQRIKGAEPLDFMSLLRRLPQCVIFDPFFGISGLSDCPVFLKEFQQALDGITCVSELKFGPQVRTTESLAIQKGIWTNATDFQLMQRVCGYLGEAKLLQLARFLMRRGKLEKANTLFSELERITRAKLREEIDNGELWYHLGRACQGLGKEREAQQAFQRAKRLLNSNYYYLGQTEAALGNFEQAFQHFQKEIEFLKKSLSSDSLNERLAEVYYAALEPLEQCLLGSSSSSDREGKIAFLKEIKEQIDLRFLNFLERAPGPKASQELEHLFSLAKTPSESLPDLKELLRLGQLNRYTHLYWRADWILQEAEKSCSGRPGVSFAR